jgi:hypothetical protein
MQQQQYNASEVFPGIWVGNQAAAKDLGFFKKYQIGAVINATKDIPNHFLSFAVYLRIPVDDSGKTNDIETMTKFLPMAMEFLRHQHFSDTNICDRVKTY